MSVSAAAAPAPDAPDAPPWVQDPAGAYSIKRHGVTITNCDDEPVRTPGCAQSHGVVMSLKGDDLTICQVSENVDEFLGRPAQELIGRSVNDAAGAFAEGRLREMLASESLERSPLYAFTVPGRDDDAPLDVTVHTLGGDGPEGRVLLEFEPTGRTTEPDDGAAPQQANSEQAAPKQAAPKQAAPKQAAPKQAAVGPPPVGDKTADEPGPSVRAGDDFYQLLRGAIARLQQAGGLTDYCKRVTEEVRELTGLDRVMVYKFHEDWHGEVIAESHGGDTHSWFGMHFPASDIPAPAREVFTKTWIRPLPDAAAPLAEMVPLTDPHSGRPLDMTYCALRGASIMYTEYLANIGVAASLTMPIMNEGKLWGLIACHHESPAKIPFQLRAACEFLAQVVSLQLRGAVQRDHLAYRLRMEEVHGEIVSGASRTGDLTELIEGSPSLLDAIDAGGAALFHRDAWYCVGETPAREPLGALGLWLESRPEYRSTTRPVFAADDLPARFPDAEAFTDVAAGVLAVPLTRARGGSMMLWFRPETERTVAWAGNPADKPSRPGPHGDRLTPRKSFELFRESVRGKARPWSDSEIEAAVRLRLLIMELVVDRAEAVQALNVDLSRSNEELDAFVYVASHDLKEPLRGISKYAYQLAEEAKARSPEEDSDPRFERIIRLTSRMDSLLDCLLHFSRVGRAELDRRPEDLNHLLDEALEMSAARREESDATVSVPRPLPVVRCDRVRVREIFLNLITNALKYSDASPHEIEVGYLEPGEDRPGGPGPKETWNDTAFYVSDNGIGVDPKHHAQVFQMFKRLHPRESYGGGTGAGLSIVKKLVERHHGHVWLHSTLGEGATFFFTLPQQEPD